MKNKILTIISPLIVSFLGVFPGASYGKSLFISKFQTDTLEEGKLSVEELAKFNASSFKYETIDSIDVVELKKAPYVNIADVLKGNIAGVFVQQPSAEPGSFQNILIRGAKNKLFSNADLLTNRAAVYVNGIPVTQEHSFAYEIQKYDFNRIGPGTDVLNSIDINSIASIEVIKDPVRLAELGPLAANGVIWITTTGGKSGDREISINGYYGFSTKQAVTPVNAHYENLFRQPFYSRYATADAKLKYPGFLADSTNLNYYGAANWQDNYYANAPIYSIDMSLRGGTDRANFGFYGAYTTDANTADKTNLDRYNTIFNINMLPSKWFKVSAFVNATRTERDRNRNLRDRYSEMAYLPDLSTPLSPNKDLYTQFSNSYTAVLDDNISNTVRGGLNFQFDILSNLSYISNFSIDYTEGIRDVFYPSELMESINFVSNYFGYSQRYTFSNNFAYQFKFEKDHALEIKAGLNYQDDLYRYNYAKAYDGPNDFIKINVVEGNPTKGDYLDPKGGLKVYRITNKEIYKMLSVFGKAAYSYKDYLTVEALARWDASSNVQRDSRWLFTPAASVRWDIAQQNELQDAFDIKASYARIGMPQWDSKFAMGPQYSTQMGWSSEPFIGSYYGFAGLSRPYATGWVGYDLGWAYTDQMDLTVNKGFFNNRLSTSASYYYNTNKDQITLIPIPEEYGYSGQYKNGMDVLNTGFDVTIKGQVFASENAFQWNPSLNLNFNRNELLALPDGLQELEMNDRLLRVGESMDKFWLYENQGIYSDLSQIPVNSASGKRLSFEGVELNAGDPQWVDKNGDMNIDKRDKSLMGNSLPKLSGGFSNQFKYKNFDLNVHFYFALGQKAINQRASNRYDFINNESTSSIQSVKEIYHWQQDVDISKYPTYNVWSSVVPYRLDQDLFLENASFLKLRTLSVGYDFSNLALVKQQVKTIRKAYIYLMANNLLTVTKFSGNDPELINFNGVYDGYGLPLTATYTLGLKLDL